MNLKKEMDELQSAAEALKIEKETFEKINSEAITKSFDIKRLISLLEKNIQDLRAEIEEVEKIKDKKLNGINPDVTERDILNRINELGRKIKISSDDLSKLLTQRTGKKWQIYLTYFDKIDPNKRHTQCTPRMGFFAACENLETAYVDNSYKERQEISSLPILNTPNAILIDEFTPLDPVMVKENWFMCYITKKLISEDIIKRKQLPTLPNTMFGELMYSVIDEYVQNLVAGNSATKKPIASKK